MSKYRNIKIHVPTPKISEAVQKKLLEDGCRWFLFNQGKPTGNHYKYLYVLSCGDIEGGTCCDKFIDATEKEVPYQSILDLYYDVKIAWANGEVLQRLIQTDDGGKWVDWHYSSYLDIESGHDWRIKPKTKTIKQWEYKKLSTGCTEVLTISFKNKALAIESHRDCKTAITEPEPKEYEVPND